MSTESYVVQVSGLAEGTTHPTLEHFFSFCGKITSISQEGTSAKITFAKESSAKTALMLTGGTLEGKQITVHSEDTTAPAVAGATKPTVAEKEGEEVEQDDKPHAAKIAEYLASGYILSDTAIEKAIQADQHYGISSRFLSFFTPLASKVQTAAQPHVDAASTKLAAVDEKQGLSLKAQAAGIIGSKYYNQALSSPFGSKVHAFYTTTSKQVLDVHEEALRIKETKKASGQPAVPQSDAPVVPGASV